MVYGDLERYGEGLRSRFGDPAGPRPHLEAVEASPLLPAVAVVSFAQRNATSIHLWTS
jgi:hypothetical protein